MKYSKLFVAVVMVALLATFAAGEGKGATVFSLAGGNVNHDFALTGNFKLAQHYGPLWFQLDAGGTRQEKQAEGYGSFGVGLWSKNIRFYVFGETTLIDHHWYGHVRPALQLSFSRFQLTGSYAKAITKEFVLSEARSAPRFYTNINGYFTDVFVDQEYAKVVDFKTLEAIGVITKRLRGNFSAQVVDKNNYTLTAGLETRLTDWLTAALEYTSAKLNRNFLNILWQGDYNAVWVKLNISFEKVSNYFTKLTEQVFQKTYYPLVEVARHSQTITTKIADLLKVTFSVDQKVICVNNKVFFRGNVTGGTPPYLIVLDFGDGQKINLSVEDLMKGIYHQYTNAGQCINAKLSVKDSNINKEQPIERCFCITVNPCEPKKYVLKVFLCDGVGGNPEPGEYTYNEGTVVNYGYGLQGSYHNLIVTLDGVAVDDIGKVTMDKDHVLKVCASKDECPQVKITSFKAEPTQVNPGQSVTISWTTQNAASATLNGEAVPVNGNKTFTINQNTVFKLVAKNDCPSTVEAQLTISVNCNNVVITEFVVAPEIIKPAEPVIVSWATTNATTVTLNGASVPLSGSKNFNPSVTTKFRLEAKNDCSSAVSEVTVVVCPPIDMNGHLDVLPLKVKKGEKITINWSTPETADRVELYGGGQLLSAESAGSLQVTMTTVGTYEVRLAAFNNCRSEYFPIYVVVEEESHCEMCDEQNGVTFHSDGSFALVRNNLDDGKNILFEYDVFNKSDCSFAVPIKHQIKYQDGGQELISSGSTNIGTIPAHTKWHMKFFYNWSTKTVTHTFLSSTPLSSSDFSSTSSNCRKVQVKLSIGDCGPL